MRWCVDTQSACGGLQERQRRLVGGDGNRTHCEVLANRGAHADRRIVSSGTVRVSEHHAAEVLSARPTLAATARTHMQSSSSGARELAAAHTTGPSRQRATPVHDGLVYMVWEKGSGGEAQAGGGRRTRSCAPRPCPFGRKPSNFAALRPAKSSKAKGTGF